MLNKKRNKAKWLPFNSVYNTEKMIAEINLNRKKIDKPNLSEEQIINLEKILVKAFYEESFLKIKYYKNGYIYEIKDKILKLDTIYHKIYLYKITLFFEQIINVNML